MRLLSRFDRGAAAVNLADTNKEQSIGDEIALLQAAEAAVAAAEKEAASARARAQELRRQADLPADRADEDSHTGTRRPKLVVAASMFAILVSIVLSAASGYMIWYQHQTERDQQRRAEFVAAASQAAATLMSIDSAKAEDNVQQIVSNSTGEFREDFRSSAADFVKVARDSKAVTKATVQASAVESMTSESAVVLVSAATTVSNSAGADQQPRNWRLSLTMLKDGGQIKMSKVEFVP